MIRNPIVTVAGHVDHGKTTILDSIRGTNVYDSEAGGITQKISFSRVPITEVQKKCPLIEQQGITLDFPGFLFIDTPGHAAFSHLRKRGGGLADLAILVMDINEGIMPQTKEVLDILKLHKIPFIIALNKVDNISGWRKMSESIKENIESQSVNTKTDFDEKIFTIMGSLHHHGFNAKPFYEVSDFTSQLALVPCSAKTGEGLSELILMLAGLSQKFLKDQLALTDTPQGVVLEIKREKTMQYVEAILYDGVLNATDEIAIASFDDPVLAKIRVLEEIEPLSHKFNPAKEITAATGMRMQLIVNNTEEILPGMPFTKFTGDKEAIKETFKEEIGEKIQTDDEGIIIRADSLGSLEALITLLRNEHIPIVRAGIGKINKKDIISAQTNNREDPVNAIIVGFNVDEDNDVSEMTKEREGITILKHDVIYKLIEDLVKIQEEKRNEIKREKLMRLAAVCKLKILPQYVFRNSNPAVFGVEVVAGKLKKGVHIMDEEGKSIAKVKDVQENQDKVEEAVTGRQVAISLPGIMFDRVLANTEILYADITEQQYKQFREQKEVLTQDEIQTLQKIAQIKRKDNVTWGV